MVGKDVVRWYDQNGVKVITYRHSARALLWLDKYVDRIYPSDSATFAAYAELEARVLADGMEGVALRYGFYYGPGTWFHPDGAYADQVRRQEFPIIGAGSAVWSWVHVEDAALATVAALSAPPGVYHVVDDTPSSVSVWLPAFARAVGAQPPPRVTEAEALAAAGEDAVYYGTKLRGASNAKARRTLGFAPRRLEWLRA